jgi:hypothetical protein
MHKKPLDIIGGGRNNLKYCYMFNTCVQLQDGKLYTCIVPAYIKYFNEYFGKDLFPNKNDSIDLYQLNTKEEMFEKLARPIPFCKYCNAKGMVFGLEWAVSKKEITEWT